MNLIEISNEYIDAIDSITGDYPLEEIENALCQIKEKWEVKAQNVAHYIVNFEEEIIKMKCQEKIIRDKMAEKIRKMESKANYIKDYLKYNMMKSNIKSIKSPLIDISLRKNPPKTIVEDELKIPSEYIKQKIETSVDKNMLKKDLQNGKLIDGAYLEESESLVIKSIL